MKKRKRISSTGYKKGEREREGEVRVMSLTKEGQ
jgi:hypothetical protein